MRLKLGKNIFLFSCYTGLTYVDVSKLKRSEVLKGIDGEIWIYYTNRKRLTHYPLFPCFLLPLKLWNDTRKTRNVNTIA